MCARFTVTLTVDAYRLLLGFVERPNWPPRYNIAPGSLIPIVRLVAGRPVLATARWGILPGWSPPDGRRPPLLINARIESAAEKPSFRAAMRRSRIAVPADGWYEWRPLAGGGRQAFLMRRRDGAPFAFAGLLEPPAQPDAEPTAAILTREATPALAAIHPRMPVLLPREAIGVWLDVASVDPARAVDGCLMAAGDDDIEAVPVGPAVNDVRRDGPELQQPVELETSLFDDRQGEPPPATPRPRVPGARRKNGSPASRKDDDEPRLL